MSPENEIKPAATDSNAAALSFFANAERTDLMASFVRTGFDGELIVIYMRPERVFGLQKAKLELVFAPPKADSSVAGSLEKGGCEEGAFASAVSATGEASLQALAVLIEYLGKTLQAQGRKTEVELEILVSADGADLAAANELLGELTKEAFA